MPHKTFTLKKTSAATGSLPVGWTVDYTYTASSREVARQRAFKALKRDHPKEDAGDWAEQP